MSRLFLIRKKAFRWGFSSRPGFTHFLTEPLPHRIRFLRRPTVHDTSFPASPPKTWAGGPLFQSHTWLNPTSDYNPDDMFDPPSRFFITRHAFTILSLSQIPYPAYHALLGLLSSTIPIRPIIPLPRLFYPSVGPVGGCPLLSRPVCLYSPQLDRCVSAPNRS